MITLFNSEIIGQEIDIPLAGVSSWWHRPISALRLTDRSKGCCLADRVWCLYFVRIKPTFEAQSLCACRPEFSYLFWLSLSYLLMSLPKHLVQFFVLWWLAQVLREDRNQCVSIRHSTVDRSNEDHEIRMSDIKVGGNLGSRLVGIDTFYCVNYMCKYI